MFNPSIDQIRALPDFSKGGLTATSAIAGFVGNHIDATNEAIVILDNDTELTKKQRLMVEVTLRMRIATLEEIGDFLLQFSQGILSNQNMN